MIRLAAVSLSSLLLTGAIATAAEVPPPADEAIDQPAVPARLAERGLLLDIARAGARLVAIGEHGLVITSDDEAHSWAQAAAPTQSMLNAVSFADATHGWAVGHDGVVLRTSDAAHSWQRIAVPVDASASFLDVLALDPQRVIAVGAYGLFLASNDAGATWERRTVLEEDLHLNRITRGASGALYLAGESGTLGSSTDDGVTWEVIAAPYDGSFYGLLELGSGRLLAHGLRGHAFVSDDRGISWTDVSVQPAVLLMSAAEVARGTIVLGGLGGNIFVSRDGGDSFTAAKPASLTGTAEVLGTNDGELVCVGDSGVHRVAIP